MTISNITQEMMRVLEQFTSKADLVHRFLHTCGTFCSFSAVKAVLREGALPPLMQRNTKTKI